MADLSRSVIYRGIDLNHVDMVSGSGKRIGCLLEEFNFGDVPGVGYKEKRSQDDGYDASIVTLGLRNVSMRGFIYGENNADLFDRLQDIRSAFTPTAAYVQGEFERGYLPLQFYWPTNNTDDFTDGWKQLELHARPLGQPSFTTRRDSGTNGVSASGQALEFRTNLECKDPRLYIWPETKNTFTGTESGTLRNRGDYPAPLSVTFVAAAASPSGNILFEVGGSRMRISVTTDPAEQIFRYDGNLKVLTVEKSNVETLRMDLLTFLSNTTHPKVPSGYSAYTITKTGVTLVTAGSPNYIFFQQAYA